MPQALHRFTLAEYHRMGETGIFGEDDRVELIDGQVVEMSPIGLAHASCVNRLTRLFAPLMQDRVTVSIQHPLPLEEYQEPQPDVVVLPFRRDGYQAGHPLGADALLVIEVGDSTVAFDRNVKLPRYARAGVRELWLVNLPERVIEVCRDPSVEQYRQRATVRPGQVVTPQAVPELALDVAEILG